MCFRYFRIQDKAAAVLPSVKNSFTLSLRFEVIFGHPLSLENDLFQQLQCSKVSLRRISYIVSVYVPSFETIGCWMPGVITLFQRNLLLAYNQIDSEFAEVALKYFYDHWQQCVTPINVALSVYAEVTPYCVEAIQKLFSWLYGCPKITKRTKRLVWKNFLHLEVQLLLVSCILKYLKHTGEYRRQRSRYGKITRN